LLSFGKRTSEFYATADVILVASKTRTEETGIWLYVMILAPVNIFCGQKSKTYKNF
jgi:hypothetical protein